ncbi:MAG: trp operon repressor [Gammaproteobacteria bacterium]|nr:trp operon repressor [Gammaproteobacteria bacterium]
MKNHSAEQSWRNFLKLCEKATIEKKFPEFLNFFLTPEERIDIGKRLAIIQALLSEEQSQRSIANNIEVSISKVTRGSMCIKKSSNAFIKFLKKIIF